MGRKGPASYLSIDLRALAAFRIGLSLLILADILSRARSVEAHYTDRGVLPFARAVEFFYPYGNICLHGFFDQVWMIYALLAVQALFAVLLGFSIATRLSCFVSWLLLVSLQQRNPLILFGGDTLLRMLLFWGTFLPLDGESHPAAGSGDPGNKAQKVFSVASAAYIFQLLILYWYTFSGKSGPAWRDGTAVDLVLRYESFATTFAVSFRGGLGPEFSEIATPLVVWWEALGPLLWFSPFFHERLRTASVFAFILMHLIFGSFIVLDLFPLVNFVSLLPLLPSPVWDALTNRISRSGVELSRKQSGLGAAVCGVCFCYVFAWNLSQWPGFGVRVLPEFWNAPAEVFWLQQRWIFFEPDPPRDGGWYVFAGETQGGNVVDAFRGEDHELSWVKPAVVSAMMSSARWIKVYANLWLLKYSSLRPELGRYLCDQWNRDHHGDRRLASLSMFYFFYPPERDKWMVPFPTQDLVWTGNCE